MVLFLVHFSSARLLYFKNHDKVEFLRQHDLASFTSFTSFVKMLKKRTGGKSVTQKGWRRRLHRRVTEPRLLFWQITKSCNWDNGSRRNDGRRTSGGIMGVFKRGRCTKGRAVAFDGALSIEFTARRQVNSVFM